MKRITLISILILLSSIIYAQENLQDEVIKATIADTSLTPEERLQKLNRYSLEGTYVFEESNISTFYEIVFPYIDKEIKNHPSKQNFYRAIFHHMISSIYGKNENFEKQGEERLKAVVAAENTQDFNLRAFIYYAYGQHLILVGDMQTGHEYMYKAISICEELGEYDRAINNLWNIAMNFHEIKDIEGLTRIINQIKSYSDVNQTIDMQYRINSLTLLYYDILQEKDPDNKLFKDSLFILSEKNIYIIENHLDELIGVNLISWDYLNHALAYKDIYPENYDSIRYYLDKALEFTPNYQHFKRELEISIYTISAELNFEQENYEQAEAEIHYALTLLEESQDVNNIISAFHDAYKFLVMFYETMGNSAEALKYQKLLQENTTKRYDNDKINVINDMSVKYEVEKKEAHIKYLELKNETARKINLLIFSLLAILIVAIVFIVISNRLRKKNLQQSIYETALLNELQQTELEKNEDEKQLLQQEYDKLNELAGESKKQAEEYAEQLQSIKQQLELKPTQAMAQKIQEMISKSLIDNYHKKEYLEKLSNLDIDMLEQGYLTADEKITNMDMKYIICFAADMESKDISLIFNIEPASVRTVRYRIKKKFQGKNTFKFLI